MRKNQTSMTAIGIAILRGIESEKPADERNLAEGVQQVVILGARPDGTVKRGEVANMRSRR